MRSTNWLWVLLLAACHQEPHHVAEAADAGAVVAVSAPPPVYVAPPPSPEAIPVASGPRIPFHSTGCPEVEKKYARVLTSRADFAAHVCEIVTIEGNYDGSTLMGVQVEKPLHYDRRNPRVIRCRATGLLVRQGPNADASSDYALALMTLEPGPRRGHAIAVPK